MNRAPDYYPESPEALVVNLARAGDGEAFAELVRRYQSGIRNFLRRCSRDVTLADDLAQQTFLSAWTGIRGLKDARAFGGWLKRIAVSVWLQHLRKNDVLFQSDDLPEDTRAMATTPEAAMDLDAALTTLHEPVRLSIILSYQEGMSHGEIAATTGIPLGTVKSHIRRGTARLKSILQDYSENENTENQ